ncbi:cytochrome P450 [Streptomyces eurythermus]
MDTQREPVPYPLEPAAGFGPNPAYEELREQPPTRVRMPYGQDAWLATRYADVRTVLSDPRFSMADRAERDQPHVRETADGSGGLFTLDPPEHSRLRRVLAGEFGTRRVERLRDRVEEVAEALLDRIVESGSPADLVGRFAAPLATTVAGEVLGIPHEAHHRLWTWTECKLAGTPAEEELRTQAKEYSSLMDGLFALRRQEPGDDVLSCLLRAHDDGVITKEEMSTLAENIVTAGFVTTAYQISGSLYHLLDDPAQLARLRDRPQLIETAVEELVRYVPLNNFILPRYPLEDIELGGVLIRAGEPVLAALASANRDPAVFSSPDDLVIDRAACPHIGFGHGPHYCIGAALARLELRVALETVLRRLPGMRLAVPEKDLRWKTGGVINGLHALPVAFETAGGSPARERLGGQRASADGGGTGGHTDGA